MAEILFTKEKSSIAKGLCILIMLAHHLFAFPERMNYAFNESFLINLGKGCGIIVGLYVFISGYGLSTKQLTLFGGVKKVINLWESFIWIFIFFIPLGFLLRVYKFSGEEFFLNLFLINTSYNAEWWFMVFYIKLVLLAIILTNIKNDYIWNIVVIFLCLITILKNVLHLNFITSDIYNWLNVFLLSSTVYRYTLFERIDNCCKGYITNRYVRIFLYFYVAYLIGNYVSIVPYLRQLDFLQYFFWFISFSLINWSDSITKVLKYLGKHSLNIWLIHTFFCYYYFKVLFVNIKNPLIAYIVLLVVSLSSSIVIEKIKTSLNKLKNV